jgi:hypothetical protein
MQRGIFHKAGHVTVRISLSRFVQLITQHQTCLENWDCNMLYTLSGFGDFSKLSGHAIPVELQNNHVGALLQTSIQQQQ